MCMFKQPDMKSPEAPAERAAQRMPDGSTGDGAARRQTDRLRAGAQTLLTSPQGVSNLAPTGKKTLLGQ